MKGFFDNPNEASGPGDTNGVFSYDPASNTTRRSWIKYADGVFEPVRKDGSLRRKKNEDHRTFSWWQVNKPADWKPADEGAGFSWNHTLGSRDDLADQKTGVPFAAPAGGQAGGNQEKSKEGTPDQPETTAPGKPAPPSAQGKADGPAAPAPPLRTLLGLGSKALEGREEQSAPTNSGEVPVQTQTPQRNVAQDSRDLEASAPNRTPRDAVEAARRVRKWEIATANSSHTVDEHYHPKLGGQPTWIKDELGKTDYYETRAMDYETRNPGEEAPHYYREYGDKYIRRFEKLKPELSKQGQKWVEKTKKLLQLKMETGLRTGQWDETDPNELEEKAFDSHSDAYLEGGLSKVTAKDIAKIASEVDLDDILTTKAIREVLEVAPDSIHAINEDLLKKVAALKKAAVDRIEQLLR